MLDFTSVSIVPSLDIYPGGCEYGGKSVHLSPPQNVVLTILRDKHPHAVSKTSLMHGVYGNGDWPQDQAIGIYAMKLRRKLRPMGIGIDTVKTYGLRLSYDG